MWKRINYFYYILLVNTLYNDSVGKGGELKRGSNSTRVRPNAFLGFRSYSDGHASILNASIKVVQIRISEYGVQCWYCVVNSTC